MNEDSPKSKTDTISRNSSQRGEDEDNYPFGETLYLLNRNYFHLTKGEWILSGIIFGGVWLIWHIFSQNRTVAIAGFAALLTYSTFLAKRRARRRRVRLAIWAELLEHKGYVRRLIEEFQKPASEVELRHTYLPREMFTNQATGLGYLTRDEIRTISKYYSTVGVYLALLDRYGDEPEVLWEKMASDDEPLPEKLRSQLEDALGELGRADPELKKR